MNAKCWVCILGAAALAGCASNPAARTPGDEPDASGEGLTNLTVTVRPASPWLGQVVAVNPGLRFAVIDFSLGGVPAVGKQLGVYRNGEKVAEVQISGPQSDTHIAADITEGAVQLGDEVRED